MYCSKNTSIPADGNSRTDIIIRLHRMGFNLIPMNGKKPCIEWKDFQTQQVTPDDIREWMTGSFRSKDGSRICKAETLNFALLTGATPWSDANPGIVVLDTDDAEAEQIVRQYCPDTPLRQKTGKGGVHHVYRRPDFEVRNRQKTVIHGVEYNLDVRGDGGYIMAPGTIHPRTRKLYVEESPWTMALLMQCPVYDPAWLPCDSSISRNRAQVLTDIDLSAGDHDELIADIEMPVEERKDKARRYLSCVPGTRVGEGADRRCSALTMKLLIGFGLPVSVVLEMLEEWGQQEDQLDEVGVWYPWSESDITRKIEWCLEQKYDGEIGDRLYDSRFAKDETEALRLVGTIEPGPTINPKDQLATATSLFRASFQTAGKLTLIHHQATWHRWNGQRYDTISDDIRASVWKWLSTCSYRLKGKLLPFQPTRNVVSGVLDALKAVANKPSSLEMPCWLDERSSGVITFRNGLLNVDEFLASGAERLLDHTPDWFSPNCHPHDFAPKAECPEWLSFLNEVFDQDAERISALQMWFGYNLIADNRQHKMAMLIGPPRSGKGTTLAVMSALLGRHNVANTSLASLAGRFGLEPLMGKMAAFIDEGHLGKLTDTSLILERLKAISGGSEQTVDRKGVAALPSVDLKVRFTMAVNELPRLTDSSAALRSRLLVIPYFNTYEGKEDFGLVDRLLSEVSGITNWALAGLRQLRANSRFQHPSAGEDILRAFVYQSSPVQAFVDECCEVGPDEVVSRKHLQLAWRVWCESNGHMAGSVNNLGCKLRAVVPRLKDSQRRVNGERERFYFGLTLSPEGRSSISGIA